MIVSMLTESLLQISEKEAELFTVVSPSKENNIGIVISHFLRDKCLVKTIESIFKYAPGVKLYIADQSIYNKALMKVYDKLIKSGHEVYFVGFDAGLGKSRNYAVQKVKEPYIFWTDNDILFTEETNLQKAIDVLEAHPTIGFVGLQERDGNEINHYEVDLEIKNNAVIYTDAWKNPKNQKENYLKCDMVINDVMARKKVFNNAIWDDRLKLAEHLDFFLNVKYHTKWKVACINSFLNHQETEKDNNYNMYRSRTKFFWQYYIQKWDINILDGTNYKSKEIWKIEKNVILESKEVIIPTKEKIPLPILSIKEEITKLDTKITIQALLETVSSFHIPFVLIKESCGEAIFYNDTKIDTKILSIAVNTKEAKTNILQLLNIKQQEMMDIEIRIFNKIKHRMYCGIECQVPLPAMGYLVEYYKIPYINIEKKFKENK